MSKIVNHCSEEGSGQDFCSFTTVYIYHYDFDKERQTCKWDLSTDYCVSKGSKVAVASILDLKDYIASCGYIFKGVVEVLEGKYVWDDESFDYKLVIFPKTNDFNRAY